MASILRFLGLPAAPSSASGTEGLAVGALLEGRRGLEADIGEKRLANRVVVVWDLAHRAAAFYMELPMLKPHDPT
jgi:hypothetical protein